MLTTAKELFAYFLDSIGVSLVALVILRPEIAEKYSLAESIREYLSDNALIANLIVSGGIGIGVFLLVGAITLSSPKLAQ